MARAYGRIGAVVVVMLVAGAARAQKPTPPPPPVAPKPEPPKGTEVELGGLKSLAPAAWKAEKPANRLRLHQFKVPRFEGDPADAEAYTMEAHGTAEQNLARWKELFVPPSDTPADKAAKVTTFEVGKAKVTVLDVSGTYLQKDKPIDTAAKEVRPDYRMLGAVLETPDGSFTVRLIGPKKTVASQAKAFDQLLRNFK